MKKRDAEMMSHWRLRTKFLLWMVVMSAVVTSATLLLVRRAVESRLRGQILNDLHNSVSTFRNLQQQRQAMLRHTSELVADLPISRALMSTKHAATIQDGSADLWRLAGTDLLVMADRSGAVLGLQTNGPRVDAAAASESLRKTNAGADSWWFGGGHLYEVSVHPIYFGTSAEERITGFLAIGSEIDDRVAQNLAEVAGVEVAFCYGGRLVRSTLAADQTAALAASVAAGHTFAGPQPSEISLGSEAFLVSSVSLEGDSARPVQLVVLKSLAESNAFVGRMDKLLLGLGILALAAGSVIVFLISRTFTRPLERLVDGVRALGGGDYEYPLPSGGHDEIAELTSAFARMRSSLRDSQKELL